MKLNFINMLVEAADPRIPHPEDAIFDGSAAADAAVKGLGGVVANPKNLSVKWDGGIALIFGYDPAGEFFINDKYMPDGFYAHSPQDWEHYDTQVKKSKTARPTLYPKLAAIWEGLKQSVVTQAVFKGDLMAVNTSGQPLPLVKGKYEFPEAPTVQYQISPNSPIGQIIKGKVGAIVVHQMNGAPWDGKSGLKNNSNVGIIAPKAGLDFNLKEPVSAAKAANFAIQKYGQTVDEFLSSMPASTKDKIKTYFNQKITGQTNQELPDWMKTNISAKQYQQLVGDDYSGSMFTRDATGQISEAPGYTGLKAIWNSVYAYKVNLVQQLEQQIKGFDQFINGRPGGEGFVFPTPNGLIKLVNRGVFGAAHFNK